MDTFISSKYVYLFDIRINNESFKQARLTSEKGKGRRINLLPQW